MFIKVMLCTNAPKYCSRLCFLTYPFTPMPSVTAQKQVHVCVSPMPPLERLFLSPIVIISFRRDRPIRIQLLHTYLEDLGGGTRQKVLLSCQISLANGGRTLKDKNFQGSNFPFSESKHSFFRDKNGKVKLQRTLDSLQSSL